MTSSATKVYLESDSNSVKYLALLPKDHLSPVDVYVSVMTTQDQVLFSSDSGEPSYCIYSLDFRGPSSTEWVSTGELGQSNTKPLVLRGVYGAYDVRLGIQEVSGPKAQDQWKVKGQEGPLNYSCTFSKDFEHTFYVQCLELGKGKFGTAVLGPMEQRIILDQYQLYPGNYTFHLLLDDVQVNLEPYDDGTNPIIWLQETNRSLYYHVKVI